MLKPRHFAVAAAVLAAALPAIVINRIVVTDGDVTAASAHAPAGDGAAVLAFKSDYLPLER